MSEHPNTLPIPLEVIPDLEQFLQNYYPHLEFVIIDNVVTDGLVKYKPFCGSCYVCHIAHAFAEGWKTH